MYKKIQESIPVKPFRGAFLINETGNGSEKKVGGWVINPS
jgi:hypothetical protein